MIVIRLKKKKNEEREVNIDLFSGLLIEDASLFVEREMFFVSLCAEVTIELVSDRLPRYFDRIRS